MAASYSYSSITAGLLMSLFVNFLLAASAGNFYQNFDITWGDGRANILNDGELLTVSLDETSGSGFQSMNDYLFAKIDMQLKLVEGDSAGTVTTYYMRSQGATWDEIDIEFLGNVSGEPYILHTNLYTEGEGNREQQFYLWFDPTADYHTYSILWNPQRILWYVDDIPIREFKNLEAFGIPFPQNQPMKLYASLWDAENWATRGGLVKTDWTQAPFTACYRNFSADACIWSNGESSCWSNSTFYDPKINPWFWLGLDYAKQGQMKWVHNNFMVYNYCTDTERFPQGLPPECTFANLY